MELKRVQETEVAENTHDGTCTDDLLLILFRFSSFTSLVKSKPVKQEVSRIGSNTILYYTILGSHTIGSHTSPYSECSPEVWGQEAMDLFL